jgi:GT2 family glycosyltransferase
MEKKIYSQIIDQSAIIILHYGNPDITHHCISSFYHSGATPDIILIDNDPKNRYRFSPNSNVITLTQEKNVGFATGVNLGLKKAMELGKKTVLLLNNDVEAPLKSILRLLWHAGTFSCLFGGIEFAMNKDDDKKKRHTSEIIFAGGDVVWQETAVRIRKIPKDFKKKYPTQFIRGSCMAIPLKMIRHIGFMEEKYWAYLEDVDFCLKASRAKYQLLIDPEAFVWHRVSQGFDPYLRNYLMARNYIRLLDAYANGPVFIKGMALGLLAALASLFRPERTGKFKGFMAGLLSIYEIIRKITGILRIKI